MASRRKKYTQEDMDSALKALQETDGNTVNKTAKEYGIPQSTLYDRVTGKSKERMGRPSILSPEEEGTLVFYAKYLAEKGFPLTVREIKALAYEIEKKSAKGRGEEPRFKDSGPGKRWWKGFKGRHPDLNFRSPDQLNKERAAFSTAGAVFKHFEQLEEILTDAKAKDKRPHTSSTTATPTAASSAMTPTTASSSKQDTIPASASTTACPTCNTPCTACNPLQSPLIQTLIPPELHDILIPIPPAKKSSCCNLKRQLTGRVLTHTEEMEEMRLEEKEKEERKECRKEEMKKKRGEKEQKELEKRLQKEKKQAETEKKLAEKEERKRKRQEDAEARKKQHIREVPVASIP